MDLVFSKGKLEFRKFETQDFLEYKAWFEDSKLKQAIGFVDEDWLKHILQDKEGVELAVLIESELIAVIGIKFPSENNKSYAITNIAVKPNLRNSGIGSRVLNALLDRTKLLDGEFWICYVDFKNKTAQQFFEKNGWKKYPEDDMVKYVLHLN